MGQQPDNCGMGRAGISLRLSCREDGEEKRVVLEREQRGRAWTKKETDTAGESYKRREEEKEAPGAIQISTCRCRHPCPKRTTVSLTDRSSCIRLVHSSAESVKLLPFSTILTVESSSWRIGLLRRSTTHKNRETGSGKEGSQRKDARVLGLKLLELVRGD
jgi:hypothetical protein